jgi:stress response protein SCP2
MSEPILIKPVNGRLPTLCFGIAWDQLRLDPLVAAQRKGLNTASLSNLRSEADLANALLRDPSEFADLDAMVFYFKGSQPQGHVGGVIGHALDHAIAHTGDDRTGYGDGWDELIVINLEMLPADVTALALVIDSSGGQPLEKVAALRASVMTAQPQTNLLSLNSPPAPDATTLLLAMLKRTDDGFTLVPVQEFLDSSEPDVLAKWWREYL